MTQPPSTTRIGQVALRVADLERMTAFYRQIVGFDLLEDTAGQTVLGAGGEKLIVLIEDTDAEQREMDEAGLFHTAFRVPERKDLAEALQRVEEHWQLDGAADHHVSEAIYLSDPKGNGIEIYWDRPREDWDVDNGMVRMASERLDLDGLRDIATGTDRIAAGTTVGHVHLEVSDLDASRQFYVDTLGFNVRHERGSALFLAAGDYQHHIGLNTWNRRTAPASGLGLAWFELQVPEEETVSAFLENVDGAERTDDGVLITDPDGITIRLHPDGDG
jgi:catechol 2,3-dioxygenase